MHSSLEEALFIIYVMCLPLTQWQSLNICWVNPSFSNPGEKRQTGGEGSCGTGGGIYTRNLTLNQI